MGINYFQLFLENSFGSSSVYGIRVVADQIKFTVDCFWTNLGSFKKLLVDVKRTVDIFWFDLNVWNFQERNHDVWKLKAQWKIFGLTKVWETVRDVANQIQKPQWKNEKKLCPNEFLQGHPSKGFTDEEKFIILY